MIERPLGRGGMGSIFLAWDTLLERHVALKRAHRRSADDVLRFKREFRAAARLSHPGLVRLYELGADDDGLYFTMEPVDGHDLAQHCVPAPLERLAAVLPELVAALSFLHSQGVVHCDLKPSNVLVSREGRVKLADFGVLSEKSSGSSCDPLAGTPSYMAPERIRGRAPTPASDAYALGCTIHQILGGRLPFSGTTDAVLEAHRDEPPPSLAERAPDVPTVWIEVTDALLAKDPDQRPTLAEVSRRLLARSVHPPPVPARAELVGRAELRREIEAVLEDRAARPVVISGPSGVGKTALADAVAARAESSGRRVFRTASRATERLPFNALDAAMDELARQLARAPVIVDRRALRIAASAFPVLGSRSRGVDRAREQVRRDLFGWDEPAEARPRRDVFDAIVCLLDRISSDRRVLLVADDFQWADDDSVALMRHLVTNAGDRVQILLVLRDDVERGVAHAWLDESRDGARLVVPPLSPADLATIVRRRTESLGVSLDERVLEDAASSCAGRPFLAEVAARALARGGPGTLAEVVRAACATSDRDVLGISLAADGWTPCEMLAELAGQPLGDLEDSVARLARDGLLRTAGGAPDCRVDLYHDGVRAVVAGEIDTAERAVIHGRIADYLSGRPERAPQRLVRHLLAAGRTAEAAENARAAAQAAERQGAFGLAADMYGIALSQLDDPSLREARAWALERSSRYADASREWSLLAAKASAARRLELSLHEAHALIAANRTADGLRRLDAALEESGQGAVRARGLRAVGTVLRFIAGPVELGLSRRIDPSLRARADRNLKIGLLLAFFDPLTGMRFLQRARADFLAAGAAAQAAGCDYTFAILALAGSSDPDRVPLADRYVAAARERARGLALPPDVRGMPSFVDALRALRRGDWAHAKARFEESVEIFRESAGTTELTLVRSFMMMMSAHEQDLAELRRHLEWFRRHVEETGGTFLLVHVGLCTGYLQLCEGAFDAGFESLTRAADLFAGDDHPNAQRAAMLIYRWGARIYSGDPASARRGMAGDLHDARGFRFLDTMYTQPYGSNIALVEANALRAGDPAASARRIESIARQMDAAPPLTAGAQWRARAYVADARGRRGDAVRFLERAESEAAAYGRVIDAAIARYQRGLRLGGEGGRALRDDARATMATRGASPAMLEEDVGLR